MNNQDEIEEVSNKMYNQFIVLSNLGHYDKLAIDNNNLYIQKISPWRYFVRKYKNQNRIVLSNFLNTEITKYIEFITKLISMFEKDQENKFIYNLLNKHKDLIHSMLISLKSLRDKYNLKNNAKEISMSLEHSFLQMTKLNCSVVQAFAPIK
jgi:hypothetical protein